MTSTSKSFVDMMEALNKRMEQFESELLKTPPPGNPTSSLAADFAQFKMFTMQVLRDFQSQMGMLAQQVDRLEMSSRRKILLLHGVPEAKEEDISTLVVNTVTAHLKLDTFSTGSISRCQRMGRVNDGKPRPILFKLKDLAVRSKLWSLKSSLKGTNITLSEFLSKSRHHTFMAARERFGVKSCWTRDGYIHILTDGQHHLISSRCELEKIVSGGGAVLKKLLPSAIQKNAHGPTVPATGARPRRNR